MNSRIFTILTFLLIPRLLLSQEGNQKISQRLLQQLNNKENPDTFFDISILLTDHIDVESLDLNFYESKIHIEERVATLIPLLKAKAASAQKSVVEYLNAQEGVKPHSIKAYWITNLIFITAKKEVIASLSKRNDVEMLDINAALFLDEIKKEGVRGNRMTPGGKELGLSYIKAPQVWAKGYTGYGRLGMGMDTGVNWQHPALRNSFRGNTYPLEHCWYLHEKRSTTPTDCGTDDHGTHTMGIMVGIDRAINDTIGVAFGAQWMGSPNLCSSSTEKSIATFQWALDPDNDVSTISDMPDVINNSWHDPDATAECFSLYKYAFDALEAAGIAIVFSAGNEGPDSSTITAPKNINTNEVNVFCVGNISNNFTQLIIAGSSSRGPSLCGGTGSLLIKPEVVAPGTNVRSCIGIDGYANYSGTSMSAPHASGAILLLKEAFPYLTGMEIKLAIYNTCTNLGSAGEDNTYGMGLINVDDAFNYLVSQGNAPARYFNDAAAISIMNVEDRVWGSSVSPTLVVRNKGESDLTSVRITSRYNQNVANSIIWWGTLPPNQETTIQLPSVSLPEGDYQLEIELSLPNGMTDERTFNNKAKKGFALRYLLQPITLNICKGNEAIVNFSTTINGQARWYESDTSISLLQSGNSFTTSPLFDDTAFHYEFYETVFTGEPDKENGSGSNNTSTERWLVFDCYYPFRLKSVLVYADGAKSRTIELRDSSGTILQSKTINIPDGESRVQLDFDILPGINYQLGTGNLSDMYRNSSGLSFPYIVPGVLSIKTSNIVDSPTKYYYYFYDWEVEFAYLPGRNPYYIVIGTSNITGSFTPSTLSVDLNQSGEVNFTDNTLEATFWLWDFDDGDFSSDKNPVHQFTHPGNFVVKLIVGDSTGCTDTVMQQIEVTGNVGIANASNLLRFDIFPNPANDLVSIQVELNRIEKILLTLSDISGRQLEILENLPTRELHKTVSLNNLPSGIYLVRLQAESVLVYTKLIKF